VVYRNNTEAYFLSRTQQENAMFLFNRSSLGVCLAIAVAALPVLFQYLA